MAMVQPVLGEPMYGLVERQGVTARAASNRDSSAGQVDVVDRQLLHLFHSQGVYSNECEDEPIPRRVGSFERFTQLAAGH
nr:hypothetical protein [Gordonia rubripertincta]